MFPISSTYFLLKQKGEAENIIIEEAASCQKPNLTKTSIQQEFEFRLHRVLHHIVTVCSTRNSTYDIILTSRRPRACGASLRGELLLGTGLIPNWLHGTILTLIKTKPRKLERPRLWISLSKYFNLSLKLIHPLHR